MIRASIFLLLPLSLAAQKASVDYRRDVHPILATRCFVCHSGDKRSGGLSLSAYEDVLQGGRSGAAIVPRDASAIAIELARVLRTPTRSDGRNKVGEFSAPRIAGELCRIYRELAAERSEDSAWNTSPY